MTSLPQRDQRGVVALHAARRALLVHESGERPRRLQLAQRADRRRIAIALRKQPMTEGVGHTQQRRSLQPGEGPVGDEMKEDAAEKGKVALMQSPSHSTARVSPIAKIWISLPSSTMRTPSSVAKLPLS